MKCKICNSPSEEIFKKIILQKYNTSYYRCTSCSFVQTDEVVWLEEAYQSAITSLDIGLLSRNNNLRVDISKIIDSCFPKAQIMLDYAGGYGAFTRLMRDAGYNFYNHDDYCENIFAKHFDINDAKQKKFDLVTGFEVLEHFNDPINDLAKVFEYSENAIFSTELSPKTNEEIENWWYIAQETGQHIAFYSEKSMQLIAAKFNKHYYKKGNTIHVFTSEKLNKSQTRYAFKSKKKKNYLFGYISKLKYKIKRKSLLEKDYEYIKSLLNSK